MFEEAVKYIKKIYPGRDFIPLHAPVFGGNEKIYLNECIDSTYVSYVGEFVGRFEEMIKNYTGTKYAVATVNGTSALHIALKVNNVTDDDEVLTQALTFVATVNAIKYCNAIPVFIDSDKNDLGMSIEKLEEFLANNAVVDNNGQAHNKKTHRRISACVPVHVFGHPCKIEQIVNICNRFNIPVIEDAAESLGSKYKDKHTGVYGKMGILSFNGNKTITTGGGGMIITNDEIQAKRARHITTTAKIPHQWDFVHDEVGYNYRMTNVNAAIGCAQFEKLNDYIQIKRKLSTAYESFFKNLEIDFFSEKKDCYSNYWLNVIFLKDLKERNEFLKYTNEHGVMTRPAWRLMNKLKMFENCQTTNLENSEWIEERLVNLPSSVFAAV